MGFRGLVVMGVAAALALPAPGCGRRARANGHEGPSAPNAGAKPDPKQVTRVAKEQRYHADLGGVHLNHGHYDQAIAEFRKAIEIGKGINEDARHFVSLAQAYKARGDQHSYGTNMAYAAQLYEQFVADPERANVRDYYCEQLAHIYTELGERPKAVEWIDRLGSGKRTSWNTLRAKARLYVRNGMAVKALETLKQAEQTAQPGMERERASYAIAEVLANMRRFEEAVARLKTLMEGAGEPGLRAEAKRLLFQIYDATGKLDELELGKGKAPKQPGGGK